MAATLSDRVVIVADSRALQEHLVVAQVKKIAVVGQTLVGFSGALGHCQQYVHEMEMGQQQGEAILSAQFHRKVQGAIYGLMPIPGVDDEEGGMCGCPEISLTMAAGTKLFLLSAEEIPMEVETATIGSGQEVANAMLYGRDMSQLSVQTAVTELVEIGQFVARTNTTVGGPWYWADTKELAVWKLPAN